MNNLKRYTLYIMNLIDIISCVFSYWAALALRKSRLLFPHNPLHMRDNYDKFLLIVLLSYIVFNTLFLYSDDRYLKRSFREECSAVLKEVAYIFIIVAVFLFFAGMGETFSRIFVGLFFGIFIVADLVLKELIKTILKQGYQTGAASEKVLIVTNSALAKEAIEKVRNNTDWRYTISGIVITDENKTGQNIGDVKVISDREHMFEDIASWDIDSVFLLHDNCESSETIKQWMHNFRKLGKIIHIHVPEFELYDSFRAMDTVGDYAVVTYRVFSPMPRRQQLIRRILNILFALALLPVYTVVYLIVALFTQLESPGRILISRVRVGRNNRRYYQFRFRVFRTDAVEREKEGKSPYTKIGKVLRMTHLDGLPMILNVLIGDVGFIGPKAPNMNKYLSMSSRERNVLSITPGIVGYWSIEDELDKITREESDYIGGWNIAKDAEIVFLMVIRYLTGRSLRIDGDTHLQEEYDFAEELNKDRQPFVYEHVHEVKKENVVYAALKRFVDIVLSAVLIFVLSPVFLVLMVMIIADDGGSPFYSHKRVGLNGRKIRVFKFRTMRTDAGDLRKLLTPEQYIQYRTEFKIDEDPRITTLGTFLRRSSLDELPQLFNVLGGSLSLVGPRPVTEEELEYYGEDVDRLLAVKPGLTGYWQAYARNNAEYETGERQAMEMYYVENRNILFDIKILFRTVLAVFTQEGAR